MQEKTSAQKPNNNRSNNKTKTTRGEKNMFSDCPLCTPEKKSQMNTVINYADNSLALTLSLKQQHTRYYDSPFDLTCH